MRRWKKYPFFLMILVSGIIYGEYKLVFQADSAREGASFVSEENRAAKTKPEHKSVANEQILVKKNYQTKQEAEGKKGGTKPKTEGEKGGTKQEENRRTFHRVEMDYLDDALFIGDSRTSTLYEYAGWENTDFFVKYGQTVWDVWETTMDGKTLEGMLGGKKYGKIYIMLGINELGRGTADTFSQQFKTVVDRVREQQPQAVIFVEAIMHVTAGKDAEGMYINNGEINARNEKLRLLADDKDIFYIDVNEVMDEPGTGKLKAEYSFDGVHLQVKYIDIWREFLLDHGI